MDKERFEDLVLRAADGGLSAAEQAELERHLDEHPEEREAYNLICQSADILKQRSPVEAPRHFANNVMREVRLRADAQAARPTPARGDSGVFDRIVRWISAPRAVVGIGAAAAVVALVAIYSQYPLEFNGDNATGTMLDRTSVENWTVIDSSPIELGSVTGSASLRQYADSLSVTIEFDNAAGAAIGIAYPENAIKPVLAPTEARRTAGMVYIKDSDARVVFIFVRTSLQIPDISISVMADGQEQLIALSPAPATR